MRLAPALYQAFINDFLAENLDLIFGYGLWIPSADWRFRRRSTDNR